jgi:hypothetical protein
MIYYETAVFHNSRDKVARWYGGFTSDPIPTQFGPAELAVDALLAPLDHFSARWEGNLALAPDASYVFSSCPPPPPTPARSECTARRDC